MSNLTPAEQARIDLMPTWLALAPVKAKEDAHRRFLAEELGTDVELTAQTMTAGFVLTAEFNEIWPHPIPDIAELVEARDQGRLPEKVAEINTAFQGMTAHSSAL